MSEKVLVIVTNIHDEDESTITIITNNQIKNIVWSDIQEESEFLLGSITGKIDLFLADQFGSDTRYGNICDIFGKDRIAEESLWTVEEAYQKIIDANILQNVQLRTKDDELIGDGTIVLHCFPNEYSTLKNRNNKENSINTSSHINEISNVDKSAEDLSKNNTVKEEPTSLSALLKKIYE